MLIGIDARLNAYRRGGIPHYTRQLLTAMASLATHDTFVTLQHPEHLRPLVVAPNVQRRTLHTPPHHRWEQLALPLELLPLRLDVLHMPDFIVPHRRLWPAVTTVHDLAFMHFPDILDEAAHRFYSQIRRTVHSAEGVIAVSEATRNDIVHLLDLDPQRIDVIYEAAAPVFVPHTIEPGEMHTINGHTLAAGAFVLFVSTLEPRKNLPLLLEALRICLDRRPDVPYRLVVAGAKGWRYEAIFDALRDMRLGDAVVLLDSVAQQDLVWLYNACRLYAMPSRYEGFGLPLLEAMACGAACLASDTSSLPEIAGEGALLLPPNDAGAWADAIAQLWSDEAARQALGERGRSRALEFSWQRAARETLGVYRRVTRGEQRLPAPLPASTNGTRHHADVQLAPELPGVAAPVAANEPPAALLVTEDAPALTPTPEADKQFDAPLAEAAITAPTITAHARPCLRCHTVLQPEELQHALTLRNNGGPPRAPRLWVCSACGYAELVVEQV